MALAKEKRLTNREKNKQHFQRQGLSEPPLGSVFRELTTRAAKFHVLQITTHINIHRKKKGEHIFFLKIKRRISDMEGRSDKFSIRF